MCLCTQVAQGSDYEATMFTTKLHVHCIVFNWVCVNLLLCAASGVARGGQGGHGPPKLLVNVFFLQLIPGNFEVTRKCQKKFAELR